MLRCVVGATVLAVVASSAQAQPAPQHGGVVADPDQARKEEIAAFRAELRAKNPKGYLISIRDEPYYLEELKALDPEGYRQHMQEQEAEQNHQKFREKHPELFQPRPNPEPKLILSASLKNQILQKGVEAAKARLRDPDSAKFRSLAAYAPSVVCGEVNAKNGYGGYAGFERFISAGTPDSTAFPQDKGFDDAWAKYCR